MQTPTNTGFYEFGDFRLDAANRLLWLGEKQISLTLKEFDVLLVLVENAGRVLTKDELLEAVWADTFVEEATLARNVSWLRKKLETGGSGESKFIETLPKRGYRFAGVVARVGEQSRAVVLEERTVTRIRVEESITLDDSAEAAPPVAALLAPPENRPQYHRLAAFAFGILAAAIAFAAYQNFFRASEPKVVSIARAAPFSGQPGRENFPSFSPDGKLITYVWNGGAGDNYDVYVRQTGAGAPVRLTSAKEDEVHPVFSPDGASVAFVRTFADRSEVYLMPSLGGAERKICDLRRTYSRLSFSPDGKTLAATDRSETDQREGIFFIDVATGAKRRVTSPPDQTSDIAARFSPDGGTLAFVRDYGGAGNELFVVSLAGENAAERQLTFDKTGIVGLCWRADGEKIIYAPKTTALASNLRQISVEGGASELIATGGRSITNPATSADGRFLVFVEESFKTNIVRLGDDSSARRFIESSGDDHSPNLSPDASRVAFVSNRTGNHEIWISDADGENQRQLTDLLHFAASRQKSPTDAPNSAGSPRFSPDGKFIAFDAQIDGNTDIYTVSADGGTPRRVTSDQSQEILPAWSRDGTAIYFASNRSGAFNLWRQSADAGDGASAVQITKNGAFESFAAPDGETIFYTRARGDAELWQVRGGGEEEHAAADLREAGLWRYWNVSTRGVYFLARQTDDALYRIKFYDFETRRTGVVAQTEKTPIWTYSGLSVSADGRTILYVQTEQNASTVMLAELPK